MTKLETINNYYKLLNNYQLDALFESLKINKHLNLTLILLQGDFVCGASKENAFFLKIIEAELNDLELYSYTRSDIDLPEERVNYLSLKYLLRNNSYQKLFNKLSSLYDVSNDSNYGLLKKEFDKEVYKTDADYNDRVKMMMSKYIQ